MEEQLDTATRPHERGGYRTRALGLGHERGNKPPMAVQFNERFRYGFPVFARSCPSHWWPSGADEVYYQGYASSSEESGGEAGLAMCASEVGNHAGVSATDETGSCP